MEFIKRNYEKIILSLVLLGLVGVLAFMPVVIYTDQQKTKDFQNTIIPRRVEPLPPLDLSRQQAVLDRLKSPYILDLSTTNKLFNPMMWQRTPQGLLVKKLGLGPNAAVVTRITPLNFSISLDSVNTTQINSNEVSTRYVFSIEDQSAPLPSQRHPRRHYASLKEKLVDKTAGGKDEGFTLVEVKGAPENPDVLLKLTDTGVTVPVSKGKPYRRVDAYAADLKSDTDKYSATGLRVGNPVTFGGDDYNVIAIDKSSVILLAQSNQKKYTLPYAP